MGDPLLPSGPKDSDDPQRPRLVILPPFYLDATEVTVAAFRESGLAIPELDPLPYSDAMLISNPMHWCVFTAKTSAELRDGVPADSLPVNCVTPGTARAFCQKKGGDLPSEAEFEYVSGALESRPYVWGNDDASCADAVWGRGGVGVASDFPGNCRAPGDEGGARPAGRGLRDRVELPTGTVVDIAGNLFVWVRDTWNRSSEPCWHFAIATDPVCSTPSAIDTNSAGGPLYVARGGGWPASGAALRPAFRQAFDGYFPFGGAIGFRCIRPARAAR
jgi:formylglycine-generating enzyme required for sulfatase activity